MKQRLYLLFALLVTAWISSSAYDFKYNGVCYNKNSDGISVTVTYNTSTTPSASNPTSYSGSITIPTQANGYFVTAIGKDAFNSSTITSISIPTSVKSFEQSAFKNCAKLTSITIPNTVTSIGNSSFYGCTSLTSITLPENLTSIGGGVFTNCRSLKSIKIPSTVKSIGGSAFKGCSGLTSINIPNSVTSMGQDSFSGCSGLTSMTLPFVGASKTITDAQKGLFCFIFGTTSYTGGTKIRQYYSSTAYKEYYIPSSLKSVTINGGPIHYLAFNRCPISTFKLSSGVTSIGNEAFYGCSKLNSISIPKTVTNIGSYAFYNCTVLSTITIPSSVTLIDSYAFKGCTGLKQLYSNNPTPPSLGTNVFDNVNKSIPLYVPTVDLYKSVPGWSDFVNLNKYISTLVSQITLDKLEESLNTEESIVLKTNILPNDASDKTVIWKSSIPSVASVDQNGKVVGIANGVTAITATTTDGSNLSAKCIITVSTLAKSITINADTIRLIEKNSTNLSAKILPEETSNKAVSWKSSNTSIAIIDENGKLTGISPGSTSIIATTTDGSNLSASCPVTIEVGAKNISLNKTKITLTDSQSEKLIASITPSNTYDKTVMWKSSNTAVAMVDQDGNVTSVGPGSAIITATTSDGSNLTASCQVTVIYLAKAISLNTSSLSLSDGKSSKLVATITPDNTSNKGITWESSDPNVATVDANGLVTGIDDGTAKITAKTVDGSNLSSTCKVTVVMIAKGISLNKSSLTLFDGETQELIQTIVPSSATYKSVKWISSDNSVATVDEGKVTAITAGTVSITATTTDGSKLSASCQVTVLMTAKGITLNKTSLLLNEGQSETLVATVTPSNTSNKDVTWKSSDDAIATVDANGKVTGVSPGTATIIATTADGTNLSASCQVSVVIRATSVSLNKTSVTLNDGQTEMLIATVAPSNATNKAVTWKSSNTSIATVDANGKVTGVAPGTAAADVIIGTGTGASKQSPFNNYYKYSTVQTIYTASEVGGAMTISQISYKVASTNSSYKPNSVKIYMGHKSSLFSGSSNYMKAGDLVEVYSGSPSLGAKAGWEAINLSTPFKYNGTDNLVVVVCKKHSSYSDTPTYNVSTAPSSGYCLSRSSDSNSEYGDVAYIFYNYSTSNERPNIKISGTASSVATITATTADGTNLSASCQVSVLMKAKSISLSSTNTTVAIENSKTLTATVLPSNTSNKAVTWLSSDTTVATVDATGKVKGLKLGKTVIAATTADGTKLSASCEVEVVPQTMASGDTFTSGPLKYVVNSDLHTAYVTYTSTSSTNYQGLTVADIPEVVKYRGNSFTVTGIGNSAFSHCAGLSRVSMPSTLTSIGKNAFDGCSMLDSVAIPNNVTIIDNYVFANCSNMTSVIIPNTVTAIGEGAFSDCMGLTEVAIPDSVTKIGNMAFNYCSHLLNVTIPQSVTSIGARAFSGCGKLSSVKVASGNTVYDSREDCNAIIESATNNLVAGCINTVIPNSVTKIGDYAFDEIFDLTDISIPNSVTEIGDYAFRYCSELLSVTIGNSVKTIGNYAFYDCSDLEDVVIGTSVTSIGSYAFAECRALSHITIPGAVTSIGKYAFSECDDLVEIYSLNPQPPAVDNPFSNDTYNKATLYVHDSNINGYATANYWKNFRYIKGCNQIYTTEQEFFGGETILVPVYLKNPIEVTGFQTDIILPEGLDFAVDEDGYPEIYLSDRKNRSHTLGTTAIGEKCQRLLSYSSTSKPYSGEDGELFFFKVKTSWNTPIGDNIITLTNSELALPDGTKSKKLDNKINVHCYYVPGDANHDKKVSIADIIADARYILLQNPDPFHFKSANLNEDSEITVSDIVLTANVILGRHQVDDKRFSVQRMMGVDALSASVVESRGDGSRTIAIALDNATDYTAFQADLYLPEGMEITGARLSDRAGRSHSVSMNRIDGNTVRVLAYASDNAVFAGNSGDLLLIDVKGHGNIEMTNALFAEPNGCEHEFDEMTFSTAPSGINDLTVGNAPVNVYNTAGQLIRTNVTPETATQGLPAGFYLVGNKKVVVK